MNRIEGSAWWRMPFIGFDCLPLIEFGKCVKEFLDSVIQSKQLRRDGVQYSKIENSCAHTN